MRSDAIDELVRSYLKQPAEVNWESGALDAALGRFEGVRLTLHKTTLVRLPLKRVTLEARRLALKPGLPARLEVEGASVQFSIDQRAVDNWLKRFQSPFRLVLGKKGLRVETRIAGLSLSEFEATLDIQDGWFVLQPTRASLLGVPGFAPSLLRSTLPLPPLADEIKLAGIEHEAGALGLRFDLGDFEEQLTPGIAKRLRKRFVPFTS